MTFLRNRLPRFAALVLLAWLFATGVAFAHTCQSSIDLDCVECCTEMKAPAAWSSARTDAAVPAQPVLPLPVVALAVLPAWEPAPELLRTAADPPDPGGAPDIPVVFLRLAL